MALPGLGLNLQGGSTASLDGQTNVDKYSYLVASAFKFAGTTTWANSLRSAHPGLKRILLYQAAADMNSSGIESGVSQSEANAHDGALTGGSTDYWQLRASYPGGTATSAYGTAALLGNIASSTFRDKWVANAVARATAAGADGIFIDNVLGYLNGVSPHNPSTGATYTDSTWATAMVAFIANVVPRLQASGLYVLTNTYGGPDNDATVDTVWWNRIGPYADGMLDEYWMQTSGNPTRPRYEAVPNTFADFFRNWLAMVDVAQGQSPTSKDFYGLAFNTSADTIVRAYTYASFLLKWNGTNGGAAIMSSSNASDMGPLVATLADPGSPAHAMEEVNGTGATVSAGATHLYRRYYDHGIVLVNADENNTYTITSVGDGRTYKDASGAVVSTGFTLGPAQSKVLTSDTAFGGGGGVMGIAVDQANIGEFEQDTSGASIALTTTAAVVSGGFIVLTLTWFGSTITLSSVSGGGLTWAIDVQAKNGNVSIAKVSAQAPAGLASGTTITATLSGAASGARSMAGTSYTGVATVSPLEATAAVHADTTTAWATTALTASAGSLVEAVAANFLTFATSTPTAPATETHDFGASPSGFAVTSCYVVSAGGGSVSVAGTWSASPGTFGASIAVSYKAAASGTTFTKTLTLSSSPTATATRTAAAIRASAQTSVATVKRGASATRTALATAGAALSKLSAAMHTTSSATSASVSSRSIVSAVLTVAALEVTGAVMWFSRRLRLTAAVKRILSIFPSE